MGLIRGLTNFAGRVIIWWINAFLDLVLPPICFAIVVSLGPPLWIFNRLRTLLIGATEDPMGKVVLITGCSSGIGEQVAYEFARRHARLVLIAQRKDKLIQVGQRCNGLGAKDVKVIVGDVTKDADCERFVAKTVEDFKSLDILVLNAGFGHSFAFEDVESMSTLHEVFDTNFMGHVVTTLAAIPHLKRSRGQIMVTSSMLAFAPYPLFNIYNASKSAITQFFDTLRTEVRGAFGITIVFPGAVASELTAGKILTEQGDMVLDQERRDALTGPTPMLSTETCATAMVDAALRRQRYLIVPFWITAILWFRMFASEVLAFQLRVLLIPFTKNSRSLAEYIMSVTEGRRWFYLPPATSSPQAVGALNSKKQS